MCERSLIFDILSTVVNFGPYFRSEKRYSLLTCVCFLWRYIKCHGWSSIIPIEWRKKHVINVWWYSPVPIFLNNSSYSRCYSFRNGEMLLTSESVRRRCSVKNVFLKFFSKLTGKHLYWSPFFNKDGGRVASLGLQF